ncbi:MAG: hypothetical protein HYW48_08255 [Deltaproteobacteria bacterium]|nr:hypothetical protein [Deltaproteobacteria bacterium]
MLEQEKTEKIQDTCPKWAEDLIMKLKQVEIYLGNIPSVLAWQSQHLDAIAKRAFEKDEAVFDEEKAEFLYRRIARGLVKENFSPEIISGFFNRRIGFQGGPAYTNADEVREAVRSL